MAYADTHSGSTRIASIATVGGIHAAIAALLAYGFAVDIVEIAKDGPLKSTVFSVEKPKVVPPPPPTDQPNQTDNSIITAPSSLIELGNSLPTVPPAELDLPKVEKQIYVTLPEKPGPIGPAYEATDPVPANDTSRWVTNADYPTRDLRLGHEGTTKFRVVVGTDGKIRSCEAVTSSGHQGLDNATCAKIERRARFKPAIDGNGDKIVGTYTSSVRWQIPD